jgi:hypothetical protein
MRNGYEDDEKHHHPHGEESSHLGAGDCQEHENDQIGDARAP